MSKLTYLPTELLNLRHVYKYDIYLHELDITTPQQLPFFTPPPKLSTRFHTSSANNNNVYPISAFILIQQPLYCQTHSNSNLPNCYSPSHPFIQDLVQPIFTSSPPISPISLSSPITPIAIPVIEIDTNKLVPFGGAPLSSLYNKGFQRRELQQRSQQQQKQNYPHNKEHYSKLKIFPLYTTPTSPQSEENILKPGKGKDRNINQGIITNNESKTPLLQSSSSPTESSSSSQSTSSSDVIIQI